MAKPFTKGVEIDTLNSFKALIHKRFLLLPPFGRYFRDEVIDLSPANHELGRKTYSFFNTLSKRLGPWLTLLYFLC